MSAAITWAQLKAKYPQGGQTQPQQNNGIQNTPQQSQPTTWAALRAKYQNYQAPAAPAQQPQSLAQKFFGGAKDANTMLGNFSEGVAKSEVGAVQNLGHEVAGLAKPGSPMSVGAKTNFFSDPNALKTQGKAQAVGKFVGDVAPYLTGAGEDEGIVSGAAKIASRAAANTAIGSAQTGSLKQGAEIGAGGELVGGVGGKILKGIGETAAKMFIPKSDAEAGMLQTYKASNSLVDRIKSVLTGNKPKAPSTSASTAFQKGLAGTESMIGVQAKRAQNKIWNGLIKPALKQASTPVDMNKFFSDAEAQIVKENPELGRQKSLLTALSSIKDEYAGVKTQTLEQLQKLKEGWANFVPDKAYKGQPITGAYNDVRNTLSNQARTHIYNALGSNVKQAYLDYGNLYGITALGRKSMTGAIKGGTGTSLKNLIEMATIPIGTIGGQILYKIGQIGEFAGPAGAKTLKDIISGTAPNQTGTNQTPSAGTLQSNMFPTAGQNQ